MQCISDRQVSNKITFLGILGNIYWITAIRCQNCGTTVWLCNSPLIYLDSSVRKPDSVDCGPNSETFMYALVNLEPCACICGCLCNQGQLREAIRDMVLRCPQTLFIFDEAEKLHPGLIDAIKPYMDHYDNVDGVSYRRAIFLFLRLVGSFQMQNLKNVVRCYDPIKILKTNVCFLNIIL